jgi:hypothetical protein
LSSTQSAGLSSWAQTEKWFKRRFSNFLKTTHEYSPMKGKLLEEASYATWAIKTQTRASSNSLKNDVTSRLKNSRRHTSNRGLENFKLELPLGVPAERHFASHQNLCGMNDGPAFLIRQSNLQWSCNDSGGQEGGDPGHSTDAAAACARV